MANPTTLKVRLLHDSVVAPANEPRGKALYGKVGEVHELPRWEALHLCHCNEEFPRAELVTNQPKPK